MNRTTYALITFLTVIFALSMCILFGEPRSDKIILTTPEIDITLDPIITIEKEDVLETPLPEEKEDIVIKPEPEPEPETPSETEPEYEPLYELSKRERWVVECMVMGESGGEPYDGQVAVAQCILNGVLKEGIAPSKLRTKYKYAGWNENVSDSVRQAVSAVFDEGCFVTDEPILYFYAPKLCTSK